MRVLVYFDTTQRQVAQQTVALLAKGFTFDLDVLVREARSDPGTWQELARGAVTVTAVDEPFEAAVSHACARHAYDLVVVAPQERQGLLRMILGTRVSRLVGGAPATIWATQGAPRRLRRIVVGLAGGPQSEQDARLAARLAATYGARLEVVHVVSQVPLLYTTLDEFHAALEDERVMGELSAGVAEVQRVVGLLRSEGVDVGLRLREGVVVDELAAACQGDGREATADLLVIGAHVRSTSSADYLLNLAEQITQAVPCPTLVVHLQSDWAVWDAAAGVIR